MVVGRERERARIAAVIDAACAGRSGTLLISGDAGIGKSTLLDDAVRHAPASIAVLRAVGLDAESDVPFAALHSVLSPTLDHLVDLPAPQADAIRHALAIGGEPTNPLAVGAATLGLLSRAAERAPILITVDDAQWIDTASAGALGFALRRFEADRIACLIAVRSGHACTLGDMSFDELTLDGLDPDAAFELMQVASPIARDVSDRCHDVSGGNPLALVEIGASLDPEQRRGSRRLDDAMPIGRRLHDAFGVRIAALGPASQLALLVSALATPPRLDTVLAAIEQLDVPEHALLDVEAAGIVTFVDGEVRPGHPLLRAAAVGGATPIRRRAAHRALADVLTAAGDFDRAAWHLAGAAVGSDEAAAAALESAAAAARSRGGPGSAAAALERAAQLSPSPADANRRLISAGDAHWDASATELALGCWRSALDAGHASVDRAAVVGRIGEAEAWFGDGVAAVDLLVRESTLVHRVDTPGAVGLLVRASMVSGLIGDMGRAVALADEAMTMSAGDGGLEVAARAARALALVNHGDERRATADLAMVDSIAADVGDAVTDGALLMFLQIAAFSQMIREDWARSRRTLATVIGSARGNGMYAVMTFACAVRAEIGVRTGRWADARADALTAIAFSDAVSVRNASFGHAVLARIDAYVGDEPACRQNGDAAREMAERTRMASLRMWSDVALGLLDLGAGRADAALESLSQVAAAARIGEVIEPGFLWWQADFAEAAIEAGTPELAARTVTSLTDQLPRSGRRWTTVAARRVSGLLDPVGADEHFEASIAASTELDAPFERARGLLCWARSDALERPERARPRALDAMEIFSALGATPWTQRCAELLRLPAVAQPAPASLSAQLSAAELRVALAIGTGATSREAAEELYVSVRTVEFHLRNIYRRLGVRSRTELALLVERERALRPSPR